MSRSVWLLVAASLVCSAIAQDPRPNILVITSDDHAAHALSCYGSAINETPHLDRLASGGLRFANAFVTNSLCGPSRAVMLTGKYTHLNGFARNGDRFDGGQPHVARYLQQAGYETATVGKWHLASDPTGFDYWNVLPGQGAYHDPVLEEMGTRRRHEGYVSDVVTDLALRWLEQRDGGRPFFLMLQHKAPHRRWQPAERYLDLYTEDVPEPATLADDWEGRGTAAHVQEMTIANHMDEADLKQEPPADLEGRDLLAWKYQRYIRDYLRCVASVDDNVGRVLDWLDEHGLSRDTVVFYVSDQGFFLGDHGWYDKRFMYEESLRTPLLVRWPGVVEAGTVVEDLVLNLDLPETWLEIAGEPVPEDMQGLSLLPFLRGGPAADWRRSIYYRYYEHPAVHNVHKHYGVRTATHKLIHYHELDEWELFDLERDPHELHSVHDNPRYADVRAELEEELRRLQRELGDDGTVHDPRAARVFEVEHEVVLREPLADLEGEPPFRVVASDDLDPSWKPLAVEARFRAAPDGVLVAHGGEEDGYSLHVRDGIPRFSVRARGALHEIAGPDALEAGTWHHVAAVITADAVLELWVDGARVASGDGAFVTAPPHDPFAIGSDDDSPVSAEPVPPWPGALADVVVRWGEPPAAVRARWGSL